MERATSRLKAESEHRARGECDYVIAAGTRHIQGAQRLDLGAEARRCKPHRNLRMVVARAIVPQCAGFVVVRNRSRNRVVAVPVVFERHVQRDKWRQDTHHGPTEQSSKDRAFAWVSSHGAGFCRALRRLSRHQWSWSTLRPNAPAKPFTRGADRFRAEEQSPVVTHVRSSELPSCGLRSCWKFALLRLAEAQRVICR